MFTDFIGQEGVKKKLSYWIEAHNEGYPMPVMIFLGPKGHGKTQFAEASFNYFLDKNKKKKQNCIVNCSQFKNADQFFEEFIAPIQGADVTILLDECFPPYVEILTVDGFVKFKDLTEKHKVAQVDPNDGSLTYVKPKRLIKRHHKGELVRFKNKNNINLPTTPNHDILTYKSGTMEWKKTKASETNLHYGRSVMKASKSKLGRDSLTVMEKFLIAYQADGSKHNSKSALFSFSKERKTSYFLKLMEEGGFQFKELKPRASPKNRKECRRFLVSNVECLSKVISDFIKPSDFSYAGCAEIIEEMVKWDGHEYSDDYYHYSSTSESNVKTYQEVATLAGYSTHKSVQVDSKKEEHSSVHMLIINKKKSFMETQNVKRTTEKYEGDVHCVEVDSGCIVVKNDDKIVVTGNCHCLPKDLQEALLTPFNPNGKTLKHISWKGEEYEIDLTRQTFIFATTEPNKMLKPLMERLKKVVFSRYSDAEISKIIKSKVSKGVTIKPTVVEKASETCRRSPRLATEMVDEMMRFATYEGTSVFNEKVWDKFTSVMNIKRYGIDSNELEVLKVLAERGACSLNEIASTLNMTPASVQRSVEEYLLNRRWIYIDGKRHISQTGREALKEILIG